MKKFFYFLSFLLVITTGCQTEEISIVETSISEKAKDWYDMQPDSSLKNYIEFYGNPDWENFFQVENEIYFPLIYEGFNQRQSNKKVTELNDLYFKSCLVLTKNDDETFDESLKIFFNSDHDHFNLDPQNLGLSFFHYGSDNLLMDYFLNNEIEDYFTDSSDGLDDFTKSQVDDCTTYYVVRTDRYSDGSIERSLIFSYDVCSLGGGGGGGFGGGGGGHIGGTSPFNEFLTNIQSVPPSCKSFKFESVASNWQASTINKFQFGIGTYTTSGNITSYRIDYGEQPITFEAWKTDRFGNSLSAAAASEIGAEAIAASLSNTAHHFKDKHGFSETQIRLWFEADLKDEFSERADGGRVTFRTNPYNQIPTSYKTTLFFNDDCD